MRKYFYYQMDLMILNVLSLVLMILLLIPNLFLFEYQMNSFTFLFLILYLFLHECFHGLGFYFCGKAKHKNIVYGIELEKGIFYCMCKEEINKFGICMSLLFPFLFLGVLTGMISYIFYLPLINLLSIMNVAGAIGDLLMFMMIFPMEDVCYKDLDDTSGFILLSNEDLRLKKHFGFKIKEMGEEKGLEAKDYKKITITKFSIILLGLLVFFSLFGGLLK